MYQKSFLRPAGYSECAGQAVTANFGSYHHANVTLDENSHRENFATSMDI